ncbi:retinol dehydrogenase 16 [Tetranychus urticae]|uniref:Uncharacterized protein n=1 Tax=Tetranychus urticae TaxID=32264 RepID=T1KSP6_TETUR|nr:retinol dehydrogenase 16 [Tetranychus urticae]
MYLIILVVILIIFTLTHVYNKVLRRCKIDKIYEKSVMVTGCDSGLGLEMAKHLHELGFITIATCLNPQSNGYQTLNLLGDRCKVFLMDITNETQLKKTVSEVKHFLRQIGINSLYGLVNNAGVMVNAEFDWLTSSQIKSQIDVNYCGPIILTKLLLEDIINSQGRLVYVTSLISNVPFPLCTTYCSTKSGLSMFAEGLQAELSRFGVKIILLQPGDFTKLTDIVPATLKASDVMWNSFDERKKELYGDYFHKYYANMNSSRGMISFKSYTDSSLFIDIEEALISINPRPVMVQSFLWYHVLIKTISYLPRSWRINLSQLIQYVTRRGLIKMD